MLYPMSRATLICLLFLSSALKADSARPWILLFDGKSLEGWRASEHIASWKVRDGCLVAEGKRSHLFYVGPVGDNNLRNFELEAEIKTQGFADSGILSTLSSRKLVFRNKGMNCRSTTDVGTELPTAHCNARAACSAFGTSTSPASKTASGPAFACVSSASGSAFGSTVIQRSTIGAEATPSRARTFDAIALKRNDRFAVPRSRQSCGLPAGRHSAVT